MSNPPTCAELLEELADVEWEGDFDVPVPPQGVIEFTRLAREPNICFDRLSSVVEKDPRLTVELLRGVNSCIYGVRERVATVQRAISLLGVSACSSILLTKALNIALKFIQSPLLPYAEARRESLERARFAKELAERLSLDPILSYTAASVQDVLLPLLTKQYEDQYREYLKQCDYSGIEEFERDTFGWTHARVTAKTLYDWGFPDSLVLRVLHHHAPPEELFLADGIRYQAAPNATASLLPDLIRQSPCGVIRLVDLQRVHPKIELLDIAAAVDEETATAGEAGLTLVNRIQFSMLEQVEQRQVDSIAPGRQFGSYVLEKKLDESAMGAVYKARHVMLRRQTAIKFLRADKMTRESVQRFEREVRLTSTLTHPNTVSVFDFGRTSDGLFYYAMEHVDGPTLTGLVNWGGPVPAARVLVFLRQIVGSVAEAHGHGLVHRDIKPDNIMISDRVGNQDHITVLDFGLVSEPGCPDERSIQGTPLYMSPEAALCSDEIDERTDLYSVGAVGYFLLTGLPLFDGTLMQVLDHQARTLPVKPSARTGNPIPVELEDLLMQCLRKNPDERPESAGAMLQRLMDCDLEPRWSHRESAEWWQRYRRNPSRQAPPTRSQLDETWIQPPE